jgi:hypothetical protein
MKRFLTGSEKDNQSKRVDEITRLATSFTEMLDWEEGLKEREVVSTASKLIKLVKKARKVWLRGGFIDMHELGHDDEPPFTGPAGVPILSEPLTPEFRMATTVRPKTRHLKIRRKR